MLIIRDRYIFIALVIVLLVGTGIVLWFIGRELEEQIETIAIHNANAYIEALVAFRELYTSEVVSKVQNYTPIVHNYDEIYRSIPLPATLSILLGDHIGNKGSGIKVRLYSPYPFPWRKDSGGLQDNFSHQAWATLVQNPKDPYFEFEKLGGQRNLRYAVADIMQKDCVQCHNSHLQTPKSDWEVGNVRGVLEVIFPISAQSSNTSSFHKLRALCFAILITSLFGLTFMFLRLKKKQVEISSLTRIDPLTNLYNRRQLDIILDSEWKRSQREGLPLSLMIIDVDFFKSLNDTYGHQHGDMFLRAIANIIKQTLGRSSDFAIRYGGDEFVGILANTDLSGGTQLAQTIITKVTNLEIEHIPKAKGSQPITVSIGLATMIPNDNYKPEDLLTKADKMLYEAKKAGRNQLKSAFITK